MKKGDLIIVYKICVGNIPTKDIQAVLSKTIENLKFLKSHTDIIQYFIPVHKESERPVEVIDTNNIDNSAYGLLEELLNEIAYKNEKE